jgi:hypothetical protein
MNDNKATPRGERSELGVAADAQAENMREFYGAASHVKKDVAGSEPQEWWIELTADGDWSIGSGNKGFALVDDQAMARAIRDAHNAALASGAASSEPRKAAPRILAKAILADGKWSHNHYSPEQMEDLISRVIASPSGERSKLLDPDPYDLVPDADQLGAASSEPEEWTGSIGGLITDANRKPIAVALNIENAKAIADAHNAALAVCKVTGSNWKCLYEQKYLELAAEREKTTEAKRYAHNCNLLSVKLEQQLLAAQAANEKILSQTKTTIILKDDHSELREHDAALVKPLVKMIEDAMEYLPVMLQARFDAALAQVKVRKASPRTGEGK